MSFKKLISFYFSVPCRDATSCVSASHAKTYSFSNHFFKIFLALCIFTALYFFSAATLRASTPPAFTSPVFPVRGGEYWQLPATPSQQFQSLSEMVASHQLPATWLLRYDALQDPQIITQSQALPSSHEVGIFLEITKSLAEATGVAYSTQGDWYYPNRIFISGYEHSDRIRLIDKVMERFGAVYGHYPSSVGAWHIDASSANYLSQKYGVTAITIVSDQYGTDRYQVWGGWWGVPYYPSQYNILTPAQTLSNRLPVIVTHWANRDPVNGYGGTVHESIYSLQANDYIQKKLGIDYFKAILEPYLFNPSNQFGFAIVGIENDYPLNLYGKEVNLQLQHLHQLTQDSARPLQVITLSQFSQWYRQQFPQLSPSHTIISTDPLGTDKLMTWTMDIHQRVAELRTNTQTNVVDLREYHELLPEPFYFNKNAFSELQLNLPAKVDTVTFPSTSGTMPYLNLQDFFAEYPLRFPASAGIIISLSIIVLYLAQRRYQLATISIVLGSAIWFLIEIKSGRLYPFGLGFWGPHGHDGIWHLALIEHFSQSISLQNPVMAGTLQANYHIGYDILQAIIHRLTGISNLTLYFHIMPFILALLIGVTGFWLTWNLTKSYRSALLAIILLYLGGNAGWVVTWIRNGSFGGESMFWSQTAISTLINPPFALSIVFLFSGLIALHSYLKHPRLSKLLLVTLLLGLLAQVKVYASLLVLSSLIIASFMNSRRVTRYYQLIRAKLSGKRYSETLIDTENIYRWTMMWKSPALVVARYPILTLTLITGITSLLLTIPFLSDSQSFFIFKPLWFTSSMLSDPDRFYWPKLEQARLAYQATGQIPKWLAAEGLALAIFLAGNLWIRTIGFMYLIWKVAAAIWANRRPEPVKFIMLVMIISSLCIPLLFIQSGTAWNTIQFMYYGMLLLSMFTAIAIGIWLDKRQSKVLTALVVLLLIILNIPTTIGTLQHYLPYRAPSRIPTEELTALYVLRQQPRGTVLTPNFNAVLANDLDLPRPLYAYTTTAYVTAISGQPSFLADNINLEITGAYWQPRFDLAAAFFQTRSLMFAQQFVSDYDISYIYLLKGQTINITPETVGFSKIFDNGLVYIYAKQ